MYMYMDSKWKSRAPKQMLRQQYFQQKRQIILLRVSLEKFGSPYLLLPSVLAMRFHMRVALFLVRFSFCACKLPFDPLTDHISHDCWVPDYCEPEHFEYKLCKLRLRGRGQNQEYTCPDGEYCEELDCPLKCWLPSSCECLKMGPHEGRMMCAEGGCFKHPSTQWGLCRPHASDADLASKEGGKEMTTEFGPARAFETPDGIVISLPAAPRDKLLLLDRDDCGHVRVWHSAGATNLAEDQITDIFMSALPGGGKRLTLGAYHVKGFVTALGVTASLWKLKPK